MQIYQALAQDHLKLKEMLSELVSIKEGDEETRHDLIADIRDELVPHARAEESLFYNSIRALTDEKKVVFHGYQEHLEAETLLRTLQVADKIDLGWKQTAKKLKDAVEHHIEEEEDKIFSLGKELFSAEEAEMIGSAFERIKPQIKDESFMKTSSELIMNLLPSRVSNLIKKTAA